MSKLFLIDDDNIVVYLTKRIINNSYPNIEIVSFEDGSDALDRLQELANSSDQDFPEFILLDIHMPMVDGWEFLEAYEKLPSNKRAKCKLMMHSSTADPKEIERALSFQSVIDFIAKPLKIEKLDSILSEKKILQKI